MNTEDLYQTVFSKLKILALIDWFVPVKLQHERNQYVYLATHDALTGLPNRTLFADRLKTAISRSIRNSKSFALIYLDLDGFKPINDTMGHIAGDKVFHSVAQRMKNGLRQTDTVCRIGGDEFAIILEGIARDEDVEKVIIKIHSYISLPLDIDNKQVSVGASFGVAFYPEDTQDIDQLMSFADISMYRAKEKRNTYNFYKSETLIEIKVA